MEVVCPRCGQALEVPCDIEGGRHLQCFVCSCRFSFADKSDTVSFAANAVSKELGENRFKQLVKKIGQDKAMEMLKGATL